MMVHVNGSVDNPFAFKAPFLEFTRLWVQSLGHNFQLSHDCVAHTAALCLCLMSANKTLSFSLPFCGHQGPLVAFHVTKRNLVSKQTGGYGCSVCCSPSFTNLGTYNGWTALNTAHMFDLRYHVSFFRICKNKLLWVWSNRFNLLQENLAQEYRLRPRLTLQFNTVSPLEVL